MAEQVTFDLLLEQLDHLIARIDDLILERDEWRKLAEHLMETSD